MTPTAECFRPECTKKKAPRFSCIKCLKTFCGWHLLFLKEVGPDIDSSQAQCLCCFLGIERTPDFRDPGITDTLARALLHVEPAFRDRVLDYKLRYEKSEERAFAPNGPHYWHPGMAPPPDTDIYEFMKQHRE